MGANSFTVEPAALRQLADHFASLAEKLDSARSLTRQVDTSGFGQAALVQAAERFVTDWALQAQRIGTTAAETGKRLRQVADQYDAVEQAQLRAQGQGTTA